MQHDFWHNKWVKNEIGFHLPEVNPHLVNHFSALQLKQGARVFLPLCGKTMDIAWLLSQGYQVVGAEISQIAIDDLFKSLNVIPNISQMHGIKHYSTANIDIFVGDIFKLSRPMLGHVEAWYDRGALVALPELMRKQYSAHLCDLTSHAPQLLICIEYDQTIHAGPPFSISADEVRQHYGANYALSLLASETMPEGLKGQYPATEQVWLMVPLTDHL